MAFLRLQAIGDSRGLRRGALLGGDFLISHHGIQHLIAAVGRLTGVLVWIIGLRRLGHAGQGGSLGDGQLAQVLIEIIFRRGGHTINAIAHVHFVNVELQHLILRIIPGYFERQPGFLGLAPQRLI